MASNWPFSGGIMCCQSRGQYKTTLGGGGGTNSFIDVSPSGMVLWLIPGFPHHQHHLSGAETWNCGKFQVTLLHTFLWDRAWAMSLKLSILKGAASSSPTRRGFVGFLGSKKIQQSKNKSVSGYLRSSRNRRKKNTLAKWEIPRYQDIPVSPPEISWDVHIQVHELGGVYLNILPSQIA